MKNILIITAHPSSQGHTHKIANTYKESSEKLGHAVTILDLYKPENALPFYAFEDIRNYQEPENVKRFRDMMTAATEIVVVHPLWWGGAPAIMKNFFEWTFTPGFAYKYSKDGKRHKLLAPRTAKVFITTGGPLWLYRLFVFIPFKAIWKYMTLEYCGMKVTDFQICGSMSMPGPKDERFTKFIEKVKKSAENK